MALEVTQILLNVQSPDGSVRKQAEESLKRFQEQNEARFLLSLAHELANNDKPAESRRLAGLVLKNSLNAKDAARKSKLAQAWTALNESVKANMSGTRVEHPAHLKQATLETLGYVCEEVSTNVLAQYQVNAIRTAVVQGMNIAKTNNDIRLAATQALYNALGFAHSNFENSMERDYLMRVVCEATECPDKRVRQAASECLVSISSTYYEKLAPYMQDVFAITSKAVREDEEPMALQAIEFWSSISLPALVLLETLTKQEEDQDQEDAWNLAMAGGTCLGLVARAVRDDLVPLVVPYVQDNIAKPDWRCREAAIYAFGSILEGSSMEQVTPLANHALAFMLNAMKDENNQVKDTTAWTLGRIFEFLHGPNIELPVITPNNLPQILAVLLEKISDSPNVAEKVCGALYLLAQGYEDARSSSPLSPFLQSIIQALLVMTDREDAGDSRLRASTHETLNEIVKCSTEDTAPVVAQLLPVIMQKLNSTLDMHLNSSDDREKQNEVHALLCGVLQVIVQKLGSSEATKHVIPAMDVRVHEKAMLANGALAYVTSSDLSKYEYSETGLQNFEKVLTLDEKILPYCDGIMALLLQYVSGNQLHRSVRPPIFACFGDIALAMGEQFVGYRAMAIPVLQGAVLHQKRTRADAQGSPQKASIMDLSILEEALITVAGLMLDVYDGLLHAFLVGVLLMHFVVAYIPRLLCVSLESSNVVCCIWKCGCVHENESTKNVGVH
ncbi:hypothetical protein KP509_37G012800 [Ceratopteris richardii]|uniref:Importin N-terminal domain-containing protein n=1 Tax=Ceratopteris richardii TaxID=49495 RepID=A0A8T2Q5I7_CERRI|nr:hypothetical protein KP509_37G012800 [Ceratopteris richardii]